MALGDTLLLAGVGCLAVGFVVHLIFEGPEGPSMKGAFMPSAVFGVLAIVCWVVGGVMSATE